MSQLTPLPAWQNNTFSRLLAQRGHALLITGAAGLGQFDLAMALAAAKLCEAPHQSATDSQATPRMACGQCEACHMVGAKSHPDLAVLLPETLALQLGWLLDEKTQEKLDKKEIKPSKQIKVESVHELINFVQRTSSRGKGLVVVIYPAEAMNQVSSNALLKSLEEPAGNTTFILAAEDGQALLPTIRSRCQSFVVTLPSNLDAIDYLVSEGVSAKDAPVWLRAAGGQPQTALVMSQTIVRARAWQDLPGQIAKGALVSDLPAAVVESPSVLVGILQKLCHDAICINLGSEPRFFESIECQASLRRLTTWSKALNVQARSSEHTLNAGLMIEALLLDAKQALASK